MSRYFEFEDDKSSKFWEIQLNGDSFTVRYGKIGTAGQLQTKQFNSEAQCIAEHDKLVAEKVKKGYIENTAGASSAPLDEGTVKFAVAAGASKAAKSPKAKPESDDDGGEDEAPEWIADEDGDGPRYFEFQDDKSSKFWEIELSGDKFRVRFGKIGTGGQQQVKKFASAAAAETEYEKLIAEKVKKGYEEML